MYSFNRIFISGYFLLLTVKDKFVALYKTERTKTEIHSGL